ncbi:MAG: FAD-dependent oxidoreductase, partial [Pikeienuella sp.]
MQRIDTEIVVIGGGVVGLSVGLGLLRRGAKVIVIDGNDDDHSASRGNFGLVWLSGKGAHYPAYARWTRQAAAMWPEFAAEIEAETGVDVCYQGGGGYELFTDEVEWRQFSADLIEQNQAFDNPPETELLDGAQLRARHPEIGSAVV